MAVLRVLVVARDLESGREVALFRGAHGETIVSKDSLPAARASTG